MSLQLKVQKFKPFDHTKVATPIGLHDSNPLLELDVEPSTTIAAVKTLIEEATKCPTANQRIIFLGDDLDDAKTLEDCGVGVGQNGTQVAVFLSQHKARVPAPPAY